MSKTKTEYDDSGILKLAGKIWLGAIPVLGVASGIAEHVNGSSALESLTGAAVTAFAVAAGGFVSAIIGRALGFAFNAKVLGVDPLGSAGARDMNDTFTASGLLLGALTAAILTSPDEAKAEQNVQYKIPQYEYKIS